MEPFLQQLTDLIQTEPTLAKWVVVPSQPHGVFLQVLAESPRRMRGRRQLGGRYVAWVRGRVQPRRQETHRYFRAHGGGALNSSAVSLASGAKRGGQRSVAARVRPRRRVGQPSQPGTRRRDTGH